MEQVLGANSRDRLAVPVQAGHSLTTEQRRDIDLSSTISGWGSDLDPASRPGVPRDKAPELGGERLYPDIEPQPARVKVHKSTEHGRLTPVFGTACPPSGLSGRMRRMAYHYSEGRMLRWLTLMAADRVDVVENLARDFARLRPPNIVREMGLKSEWRHNRAGVMKTLVVGGAVLAVWMAWSRSRR